MSKKTLPKKYKDKENVCPLCGSTDVDIVNEECKSDILADVWEMEAETVCLECDTKWTQIFFVERLSTYARNIDVCDADGNELKYKEAC